MDYAEIAERLPENVCGGIWFSLDGDGSFSFNASSPAGEDLWIEGDCRSPETAIEDIRREVRLRREAFDVGEHVMMWAPSAGKNGTPDFETLVDDAKAIRSMLAELDEEVGTWSLQGGCGRYRRKPLQ